MGESAAPSLRANGAQRTRRVKELAELVGALRLLDIRAMKLSGELPYGRPYPMKEYRWKADLPRFRMVESHLECRFDNRFEIIDCDGDMVGDIEVSLMADFDASGYAKDLSDEALVSLFLRSNVYFMVFPYLREFVSSMCMKLGLDPLVLEILSRDDPYLEGERIVRVGVPDCD